MNINRVVEIYDANKYTPLKNEHDLWMLKDECLTCPMFKICNGCHKTIKDMKRHDMIDDHCKLMKQLAPRIMEINNV